MFSSIDEEVKNKKFNITLIKCNNKNKIKMKELERINKEEAKKLRIRFNNELKVVSWTNLNNPLYQDQSSKLIIKNNTQMRLSEIKERINKFWLGNGSTISQIIKPAKRNERAKLTYNKIHLHNDHETAGLKIDLKGRIRGAAKRKKIVITKGSIKSQTINKNIEVTKKEIYTKWGILGLRVIRRNN